MYLGRAGIKCLVLERSGPAAEASGGNAGFIRYAHGLETGTVEFVKASLALLFELAEEGEAFDLVREGYLLVAPSWERLEHLRMLHGRARAAGLKVELLGAAELRALEPALGEAVTGGLCLADAGHVDPVRTTQAFVNRARRLGVEFRFGVSVDRILIDGGRVTGVEAGAKFYPAPNVVLAAGAWSKGLAAGCGLSLPVEPARGQMLATVSLPPLTRRVIRGPEAGLRQNPAGEVIIGSTVEFVGFDKGVDPATIKSLFEKGRSDGPQIERGRRRPDLGRFAAHDPGLSPHHRPCAKSQGPLAGHGPQPDRDVVRAGHGAGHRRAHQPGPDFPAYRGLQTGTLRRSRMRLISNRLAGTKIVVIGAGAVGAVAAYRLAQAGAEVTIVERRYPGGGTSGNSFAWLNSFRKFPRHYHQLNVRSIRTYPDLALGLGDEWLHPDGAIHWAWPPEPAAVEALRQDVRRLREWGYQVEVADPEQVRRELEPDLLIPPEVEEVYVVPGEGWLG